MTKRANACLWAAFGLGVVLRLIQYLYNRSFWQDEVELALNVIQRDFAHLAEPLAGDQAAPYLVLVLFKAMHALFGVNDYAFRFAPLAFSIGGLALFVPLSRRLLSAKGALGSVILLAIAPTAVNFSVEYKQYAVDGFATIWILLALTPLLEGRRTPHAWIHAAIAGGVSVWLSFPAVFVLAGAGTAMLFAQWKAWQKLGLPLTLVGLWIALFAGHYALVGSAAADNDSLNDFWGGHMLPLPTSLDKINVFWHKMLHIADYSLPYPWPIVPLMAAYVGFAFLARKRPVSAAAIGLPFLAVMGASMLGLYPIYSRLILFLQPLVCLATGVSVGYLAGAGNPRSKLRILCYAVAACFLLPLVWESGGDAWKPSERQATQSVARALADVRQPEQPVLVRPLEARQLGYYAERYGIPADSICVRKPASDDPSEILSTLYPIDGQTLIWVFILQRYGAVNTAKNSLENTLRPTGRILGSQRFMMCDLYLIDVAGLIPPDKATNN